MNGPFTYDGTELGMFAAAKNWKRCRYNQVAPFLEDDAAEFPRAIDHLKPGGHLGLWDQGVRVSPTTGPPAEIVDRVIETCFDDPFPGYPVTTSSLQNGTHVATPSR